MCRNAPPTDAKQNRRSQLNSSSLGALIAQQIKTSSRGYHPHRARVERMLIHIQGLTEAKALKLPVESCRFFRNCLVEFLEMMSCSKDCLYRRQRYRLDLVVISSPLYCSIIPPSHLELMRQHNYLALFSRMKRELIGTIRFHNCNPANWETFRVRINVTEVHIRPKEF